MHIVVDAFGGDNAPLAPLKGAALAAAVQLAKRKDFAGKNIVVLLYPIIIVWRLNVSW